MEVTNPTPEESEIRAQLREILATPAFARSPNLSRFLEFAVVQTLAGEADALKEYRIGADVFGRGESFDPRSDTIVRTQAHRLRVLLQSYYSDHPTARVAIDLGKGSYVPVFRRVEAAGPQHPAATQEDTVQRDRRARFQTWAAGAVCAASIGLGLWGFAQRDSRVPVQSAAALFTMELSPTGILDVDRGGVEFSPSGRSVVFPLLEASGARRLWIRSLASGVARPLDGADGAYLPFWSPDETRIGFFQSGRLKTYRVSDGSMRDLAAAPLGRGGSWNDRGVILFAPHSIDRIYRIPEDGGKPVAVTELDRAREEIDHRSPEFLPDGRRFLYTVRSRQTEGSGVSLGSLDSREVVRVLDRRSPTSLARTPQGDFLVYEREGAVRARRFDAQAGRLLNEEILLLQGVRQTNLGATFSVGGGQFLAFWTGPHRNTTLNLFDRAGRLVERLTQAGFHLALAYTSEAGMMAVEVFSEAQGSSDIYISELRKTSLRRFTLAGGSYPVWGRGGRTLFYSRYAGGLPGLYEKRGESGSAERLVWKPAYPMHVTNASAGGRWLVIKEDRPQTLHDVALLPLDPATQEPAGPPIPVRNTRFNENSGVMSHDEKYLAYVSDESGRAEVYVIGIGPDGRAGRHWRVSPEGGYHPRWRRDGRELYYLSPSGEILSVQVDHSPGELRFAGPVKLFDTLLSPGITDTRSPYVVSADGQRFAVNTPEINPATLPVRVIAGWTALLDKPR